MSPLIDIFLAFFVIVTTFFIWANHNRGGSKKYYQDLEVVTLASLPPKIYFTIMEANKDGYIIEVMQRLPDNNLVSTNELLRLIGEKDLNNSFTYYVFETMLNGRRRYLEQADYTTSPAA